MTTAPLAQYSYFSVFRRGAAADIPATDPDPLSGSLAAARATPNIALQISATGPDVSGTGVLTSGPVDSSNKPNLFLYGPGDVVGFDKRHVVVTEPADGTASFESNYFAGIEFDEPDIPWLFTPAQAVASTASPAQSRLRPWLVLIVLEGSEFTLNKASTSQGLDWITLSNNPQVLPDLAESWAWAHTQLTGALQPGDDLAKIATQSPQRLVSRLLCPRSLKPDAHYTGFLVPAFLMGAQAGLPPTVSPAATANYPLGPAWNVGDAVVNLPVYHSFSFSTADAGDFKSLALRLEPRVLTGVGSRALGVDDARNASAWGVVRATSSGSPLDLHGALDTVPPPGSPPATDPWSGADQAAFKPALAKILNVANPVSGDPADPDPVVVPPIYGRYYAAVQSVDPASSGWVNELNLDPRLRAPAGLGAQVVTSERSALMASAWRQIAGIELANRILRHAQMVRASLRQAYQITYSAVSPVTLLTLAANVLRRIVIGTGASAGTAWSTIAASPIPWRVFFPGVLRRIAPLGPVRTQQGQSGATTDGVINGLNNGTVTLLPPTGPGSGTGGYPNVTGTTVTVRSSGTTTVTTVTSIGAGPLGGVLGPVPPWLLPWVWPLSVLAIVLAFVLGAVLILVGAAMGSLTLAVLLALVVLVVAILIVWWLLGPSTTTTTTTTTATPPTVSTTTGYGTPNLGPSGTTILGTTLNVPNMPGFTRVGVGVPQAPGTITNAPDSGDAATMRGGLQTVLTTLNGVVAPPPPPSQIDLGALAGSVLQALDPSSTVVRRALSLVQVDPRLNWAPADPIEPIMAAPDFPQPMYQPLCHLSQEYLLPGIGKIPRESVGLLQPNQAFIESYMVGLNSEMGRQLLWNGYPTDQRGSYFRQFWDVSGYVPAPAPSAPPLGSPALAEKFKDISPIHTWDTSTGIGTHPNPASPAAGSVLVLLIRGELLRRYPTAHVYAVPGLMQTRSDGSLQRIPNPDSSRELHPLFRGTMAPDLSYFGFGLSPDQVHSGPDNPGYYFVLQQHPTQPRFGLEVDSQGTSASWKCFLSGFATVAAQSAPAKSLPPGWGSDAATMASMTYRNPVQVAIHADLILPG